MTSSFDRTSACLSKKLQKAVVNSGFSDLIFYRNRGPDGRALPSPFLPQVDASVILLSPDNKILGAANILYDRDHPDGYSPCLKRSTLTANQQVRFYVWRESRWLDPAIWSLPVPEGDLFTNPKNPKTEFMLPFPASCLKTLVGFGMMRLVDQGLLTLNSVIAYDPRNCPPPPAGAPLSQTLDSWLNAMMTVSSNFATIVLLQWLYQQNHLEELNQYFSSLGLETLQLNPARPECGRDWYNGKMGTGSLDACKLLMIIFGVRGCLWKKGDSGITADSVLSPSSQRYLQLLMANYAFVEVLNPVAVCGSPFHEQGFKTTVPEQYINKTNGQLEVVITYDGDRLIFPYDMRPCLQNADRAFAHKTGLAEYAGADHGYLQRLDNKGNRLIIALHTSAGSLFQDPKLADQDPDACFNLYLCYSNAFSRIARAMDSLLDD